MLVGLKIPDASAPLAGSGGAVSSKVRVTLVASTSLPTSDMSTTACPAGPTSSTSTSLGRVWLNTESHAWTFVIAPSPFGTTMVDGYGVALPLSGIVVNAPFMNDRGGTVAAALPSVVEYPTMIPE